MIEVDNLRKSYAGVEALRGITFSVAQGEIIGLLGPNGAGKTTLMKILTGYLHPSAGSARVGGLEVVAHPQAVQAMIGYLPENAPLYPELTVQSSLLLIAELRRIPKEKQRQLISEAVRAVGLETRLITPISTLSKGYRQRLGLAQAILHKPRLLILDEPTNGLDPTQILEVRRLIKRLARNSTVMLSTHILSEVEATCDRAIIIMDGEIKADAHLSELAASAEALVTIDAGVEPEEVLATLSTLDGVQGVEVADREPGWISYRLHGANHHNFCPAVYELARDNGWLVAELRREERTLETVFGELAAAAGGA